MWRFSVNDRGSLRDHVAHAPLTSGLQYRCFGNNSRCFLSRVSCHRTCLRCSCVLRFIVSRTPKERLSASKINCAATTQRLSGRATAAPLHSAALVLFLHLLLYSFLGKNKRTGPGFLASPDDPLQAAFSPCRQQRKDHLRSGRPQQARGMQQRAPGQLKQGKLQRWCASRYLFICAAASAWKRWTAQKMCIWCGCHQREKSNTGWCTFIVPGDRAEIVPQRFPVIKRDFIAMNNVVATRLESVEILFLHWGSHNLENLGSLVWHSRYLIEICPPTTWWKHCVNENLWQMV